MVRNLTIWTADRTGKGGEGPDRAGRGRNVHFLLSPAGVSPPVGAWTDCHVTLYRLVTPSRYAVTWHVSGSCDADRREFPFSKAHLTDCDIQVNFVAACVIIATRNMWFIH